MRTTPAKANGQQHNPWTNRERIFIAGTATHELTVGESGALHELARDVFDGRRAHEAHGVFEFCREDFQAAFDAGLAERGQAPKIRTAHEHGGGAERECLEYIAAAAKTAVDQHRNFSTDRVYDFGQRFD